MCNNVTYILEKKKIHLSAVVKSMKLNNTFELSHIIFTTVKVVPVKENVRKQAFMKFNNDIVWGSLFFACLLKILCS